MQERRTYDENIIKLIEGVAGLNQKFDGLHEKLDGFKEEVLRQIDRTDKDIRDLNAAGEVRDERITSLRNKAAAFGTSVSVLWAAIETYFHFKK